mmetsp:Transcript_45131/g.86323  ORF Transcript_45131/g.86323 Transcript_45131/m.86323 type:complete len:229 (-) Transcript_45131:300-986(-)
MEATLEAACISSVLTKGFEEMSDRSVGLANGLFMYDSQETFVLYTLGGWLGGQSWWTTAVDWHECSSTDVAIAGRSLTWFVLGMMGLEKGFEGSHKSQLSRVPSCRSCSGRRWWGCALGDGDGEGGTPSSSRRRCLRSYTNFMVICARSMVNSNDCGTYRAHRPRDTSYTSSSVSPQAYTARNPQERSRAEWVRYTFHTCGAIIVARVSPPTSPVVSSHSTPITCAGI